MFNKYLSIFYSTKTKNSVAVNHRRFSPRSVRFLNRRNCLVLIAVVGVLTAFLLAGADIRHPAQAAPLPQTTPPPTLTDAPSGEPDYTNVDDILDGRRSLLRSDDLTLVGRSNSDDNLDFRVLKTSNSEITDVSPRYTPPAIGPGRVDSLSTQMGRMFAFEADVMATAYTQTNRGRRIMGVSIYSPTAKTYSTLELADTFSFSTTNYVINATKMADFNHDGFDDLVVNYTNPNGQSGIQIINARNVDAFSEGLIDREVNTNTKSMGAYSVVQSLYNSNDIPVDSMTVGDINGDGQLEILGVVPGEGGTGLQLVVHTVDQRTLQIADAKYYPLTGTEADGLIVPQAHIAAAVGKFTTTTHDQLLVAWAVNDHLPVVQLVDFVQGKSTPLLRPFWHGDTIINTGTEGIYTDTALLRLKVGRLNWSSQYDEAVLLHGYNRFRTAGSSSYNFTISNLAVSPADFSIRQQSSFKTESIYGTAFDITLGNFDNRSPDPLNPSQTERNPNLQVALLTTDSTGYYANIDIFNIDQTMGTLNKISTRTIPQESPQNNFGFVAGDMQGRSMRLGEPTKITINGTAQPTVVAAAPPMHVDFIAAVNERQPKVLNVSAIPENFYTSYETEDKATTQSSSAHTTSWSFGAKESYGGSFEIGSVKAGEGVKFSDTFTAAQALKGSTERTHGSYTTHEFDISQKTNFSDQLWYSESNFNIYIYPVIGQTVCPASKADENGNCADSVKVPLTIQFSGPDHVSYETIAAGLVEWYQPPWEYGNLFSYPGSYAQLQQIVPDIYKLSTDLTWATDGSDFEFKTRWATGTTDGTSTGLSQNYSFENDFSVQGADGVPGLYTQKANIDINTSGSVGFNDLNKSTTNLGKSTGIGVNKPGSFLDPASYNYSVTPYIFGHLKPGGSVDNIPLTGDVQTFGLLQTAFVVDPTRSTSGGWWKQAYTKTPDIALNHPNRWKLDVYPDSASRPSNCLQLGIGRPSQMNCAEIAPASPENPWLSEFHDMRGFFISKASNPGEGPQLTTAKVGDKLRLQARVYNYSLKQMNPDAKVHVRFYGMQWNSSNATPAGDSFLIGEDVIVGRGGKGPIPPFDSDPDGAPVNWVLANTNFDTAPYGNKDLVFWVVVWSQEADGTMTTELPEHGLKAIPTVLKNLVDVHLFEPEYSNNVGFYKSVFHIIKPSTLLGDARGPGNITLRNLKVSDKSIDLGRSVVVSAFLLNGSVDIPGANVLFYDGDPQQGGRAFDVEQIPYLRAKNNYRVKVLFRPESCGTHRIFITVGAGKPFEISGSTQVDVMCAAAPVVPRTKADCRNKSWRNYRPPAGPFRNEDQCISYVTHSRN